MPGAIVSRRTMKNRDWKEARGHVQGNHTVRPGHVREQARRHGAREGRADRQRREIRAQDRSEGVPGRPLRAGPDRQGRQARAQGAEIEGRPVRVRGDRTPPQTRGKRRGGADRHVPGRRVRQAGRRHRPVAVGRPHAVPDIERQAQARVRRDRRMAHEAVG